MLKNVLSLVAFVVAALAVGYLVLVRHLFATRPAPIAVQASAVVLMLWARATFGLRSFHAAAGTSDGGLVTAGPYRFWRHPIYASIIYFVWAGELRSPTVRSVVAAGVVSLALVTRMLLEERALYATYPEYAEYARRAKRLIPFVA